MPVLAVPGPVAPAPPPPGADLLDELATGDAA